MATGKARKITRSYVDLPDGQVHLLTANGTNPPILFLHQTASAATTYEQLLERLPLPNRLIAMDTPGFGMSFKPCGWPTLAKYADWVVATADKLKVSKFHVLGHHTGASLAVELPTRHPRRISSIMLLGPVPMNTAERLAFRKPYGTPVKPQADGSHLMRFWNYAHGNNLGTDLEIIHDEVTNIARAWKGRAQAYRAVSYHDSMKALRKVACPILLITSKQDFFHDQFDRVRAVRPDADVAEIGGQAFPMRTHTAEVARAIAAFINRRR